MATKEIMKCDLCGKSEEMGNLHSKSTLHINVKVGRRLFWWRGRRDKSSDEYQNRLDICDECIDDFHELKRQKAKLEEEPATLNS